MSLAVRNDNVSNTVYIIIFLLVSFPFPFLQSFFVLLLFFLSGCLPSGERYRARRDALRVGARPRLAALGKPQERRQDGAPGLPGVHHRNAVMYYSQPFSWILLSFLFLAVGMAAVHDSWICEGRRQRPVEREVSDDTRRRVNACFVSAWRGPAC